MRQLTVRTVCDDEAGPAPRLFSTPLTVEWSSRCKEVLTAKRSSGHYTFWAAARHFLSATFMSTWRLSARGCMDACGVSVSIRRCDLARSRFCKQMIVLHNQCMQYRQEIGIAEVRVRRTSYLEQMAIFLTYTVTQQTTHILTPAGPPKRSRREPQEAVRTASRSWRPSARNR